jgi:hypothetical protein
MRQQQQGSAAAAGVRRAASKQEIEARLAYLEDSFKSYDNAGACVRWCVKQARTVERLVGRLHGLQALCSCAPCMTSPQLLWLALQQWVVQLRCTFAVIACC